MISFFARWIFRAALLVLLAATLVFALVAFVLNTESGTRWVIARADEALPGVLTVGEFEGTIWSGMRLESLSYVDASQRLEFEEVAVDLFWPAIIAGRLTIDNLAAKSVRRESLSPRPEEPQPLQIEMRRLPLPMALRSATVASLEISNGEQTQRFQSIVVDSLRIDGRRFVAEKVRARRENIRATAKDLSIRLSGPVATTADVSWKMLDGDWSGQGTVSGSLTELRVQQQVSGPYPANVSGKLFVLGRVQPGFDASVRWDNWTIAERKFADGAADLRGTFDEADAEFRTTFENDGIEYSLSGTATGNLDALSSFSANIRNDQVDVDLVGRLILKPEFSATATATANAIDAGLLNSNLQGRFNASGELAVDANGTLTASQLIASGTVNDTDVQASGSALLAADRWRCTNCELNAGRNRVLVNAERDASQMTAAASLNAPELSQLWPGLVGAATGEATINGDRGEFVINWQYQDIVVSADAVIRYSDQEVAGTVRSATVTQVDIGDWQLQNPFDFRAAAQDVQLDSSEWRGELGVVRIARLQVGGDQLEVNANIQEVPLQMGNQALPPNYRLSGYGSADVDLRRQAGLWNGTLNWSQTGTVLQVTEINGDITDLKIPRADATADLVDNRVTANGRIEIDPGVTAEVTLSLADLAADAAMTGTLKLTGDDWSWISALVPQIDRFTGAISADVAASGPLDGPTFSGTAKWQNGSVAIPAYNVRLKDVGVTLTGVSDGDATVEGSARSGGGELQLTGRLEDLLQSNRRASFTVTGKDAELVNWPEYRVWGSPDIQLTGNLDAWKISGRLDVPRAEITPREVPVSAVKVSPDVVVLGEEGRVVKETLVTGETRLVLGDNVTFSALGLETRLKGDILFKLLKGRPISAEGRLTLVEGTYATQGQNLEIEQGELVFTGPLDDPLVDVRAVRIINDFGGTVKAGIYLRGRAQNLTTTVFSEPTMADADALSYLVLGRPLSQASDTDGNELSGAAVALGLRQVTRITDQIGQSIGVDELTLAGDGGDTTALVAGKQVNSRLYARYAYGVFSQLGTLLLRYRLNRNLTLEAGTGENQSLDILYTVEK